jgi:DNA-binding LytR/AlgR family response regulator
MVESIKKTIEGAILIEDFIDVKIELATTNPNEVLDLFREKEMHADGFELVRPLPLKRRLIFLDINFGLDYPYIDGIKVASEIRKYDISSDIVFVTSSGEERADVLEQKIVALGYLKKSLGEDDLRMKIVDLLKTARQRMSMSTVDRKMIEFKTGHAKRYVNLTDIYYLKGNDLKDKNHGDNEPRQGLTILCEANGISYLKRKLKFYDEEVPELVRLGRSYLVNPLNVRETRTSGRKGILTMANGEELSVLRESFNAYEEQVDEMRKKGLL